MMAVPMEAETGTSGPSASSASTSASTSSPPPGYTLYLGDSEGLLKRFRVGVGAATQELPTVVAVEGLKSSTTPNESLAVQRMAEGVMEGVGQVIAIARKNATIDVVTMSDSPRLITTIKNDKMKAGLQRWVGLAVSSRGVYACTSAGDWALYTREGEDKDSTVAHRIALPEPLQNCVFYPAQEPKWFAYGGEEVPLSLWDVQSALRGGDQEEQEDGEDADEFTAPNGESSAPTLNSKQRKRKRQAEARAKAKELLPGEVWRAKNLPNDALSLPRRPNVTSIAVLQRDDDSEDTTLPFTLATGTRDGLVRLYTPSSTSRKHTSEIRVVPHTSQQGQVSSAIKGLYTTTPPSNHLIAADGASRLTCVDWKRNKSRYQWKEITGSVASVVALQGTGADPAPLVLSSSFDRLLRLHTVPSDENARGKNLSSTFTGGASVTGMVWDGVVPEVQDDADADESMRSQGVQERDDDNEEDEEEGSDDGVWDAMQEVGAPPAEGTRSKSKQGKGGDDEDGDDDDEETHKDRSKRKK